MEPTAYLLYHDRRQQNLLPALSCSPISMPALHAILCSEPTTNSGQMAALPGKGAMMPYRLFTIAQVKRDFRLVIDEDVDLFSATAEVPVSAWLTETLQETLSLALAINTEKVRSELLIAPIPVELRKQTGRTISLFSGVDFNVDETQGLNGVCDYIISRSAEQLFISAPVLIIFEAKNENIKGGFAQCIAAMIAAQRFNEREDNPIAIIHGVVTTGTSWRFLQLEANIVRIDAREYYIDNVEKLMGILTGITGHLVGSPVP